MPIEDVGVAAPKTAGTAVETIDPSSGGQNSAIVGADGAGGATPLTATVTAGAGAHHALDVAVQGSITATTSAAADVVTTGSLTAAQATAGTPVAGGTVTTGSLSGMATVAFQLTGTWVGTVIAEVSPGGTTWVAADGLYVAGGAIVPTDSGSGVTNNCVLILPVAGYSLARVRMSARASGSVSVTARVSEAVHPLATMRDATGASILSQVQNVDTDVQSVGADVQAVTSQVQASGNQITAQLAAAINVPGGPAPGQAAVVAGVDSFGNSRALNVDATGKPLVTETSAAGEAASLVTIAGAVSGGAMKTSAQGTTTVGGTVAVSSVAGNVAITAASLPALSGTTAVSLASAPTTAVTAVGGGALATDAHMGGGLPVALGAGGGLKIDGSGTVLPVSMAAAPTGAALEAGHLATIDAHIPAQGQALAAASVPVVLTAIQVAQLAQEAGNLATVVTRLTTLLTQLPASLGAKTGATSLSIVGASNVSLRFTDATPTGQIWTVFEGTRVDSATATGVLVVPAAAGQYVRAIKLFNFGTAVQAIFYWLYDGAAPAFGGLTNIIDFGSLATNSGTGSANTLNFPGGWPVTSGATMVISTSTTAFAQPTTSPVYASGLYGT